MASNETVQAITARDTIARLDQLIRRHGGHPSSLEPVGPDPKFPPRRPSRPMPGDQLLPFDQETT